MAAIVITPGVDAGTRLANAIAGATEQLKIVSEQLDRALSLSQGVIRRLYQINDNAARVASVSQARSTNRQPLETPARGDVTRLDLNWLNHSDDVLWRLGAVFAISRAWAWALGIRWRVARTLWSKVAIPIGRQALALIPRVWTAIMDSEIFETIAEAAGAIAAAAVTFEGVLIFAGAAIAGTALYQIWKQWDAVKKALQSLAVWLVEKVNAFGHEVLDLGGWLGQWHDPSKSPIGGSQYFSPAALGATPGQKAPLAASAQVRPRIELFLSNVRLNAGAAMLAAPLLVAPAAAQLTEPRTPYEIAKTASVVINSSPTITINAVDCHDIGQRVLAALKEHREALFEQWCGELQRRQRTEF
jgi:hypothetical protein